MKRVLWAVVGVAAACWMSVGNGAEVKKPAVLFTTGLHTTYVTKPLHADGIEIHTCAATNLPELLASGRYNVAVVTDGLANPRVAAALKAFLEAGGGVLMFPGSRWEEPEYIARQRFLEGYGAHWTMTLIRDSDTIRVVSTMFASLDATETILPPFNAGVPGLLYLDGASQSGMRSPVSVVGDGNWKPAAKASPTAKAVGWADEKIQSILPYVPKEPEAAPALVAVREAGKGRLAAIGIGEEWLLGPPANCPAAEDMLTRGRGGKPSNWVHLFANLFRWMAEPTLASGKGGEPTPAEVLNPSAGLWKDADLHDWTKAPPIDDQDQLLGLIGARSSYSGGKASVDDWVKAARAAGLQYLIFLEPLESTTDENFKKLRADCARLSDEAFYAGPGIWGRDLHTKTAMFAYGDNIQYPLTNILTADRKYFENSIGMPKQMRTKYIFDYFFEQLGYRGQFGYFRHHENVIPPWEYKMNHVFPIYSTENGKKLDDNFDDFSYLQAQNFCYHPASFSLMDDPSQIKRALAEDWLTINVAPGEFGDGTYTKEYGKGAAAMKMLFAEQVAWLRPFQYVTQGPRIRCWRGRWEIVVPSGEWFRPDLWRYRARLHVASDVGLKEITIMSVGKVLYRFLPAGAREFDRTFEFENSQQRAVYPIITDVNGKRAIGSYIRNANTLWNEFICGDRCNYLSYGQVRTKAGRWEMPKPGGNAVTHNKGGWMPELTPSTTLTLDYPTMPVDGAPQGQKTPSFPMNVRIDTPGYVGDSHVNCKPKWVLSGPDVLIGGGYLNHVIVDEASWGNAWSWWSPIKPNEFIEGYGQHTAWAPWPAGLRAGWYEFRTKAVKDLPLQKEVLPVTFTYTAFTEFRDAEGRVFRSGDTNMPAIGAFHKGAYVLVDEVGGPAGLVSMDDALVYSRRGNEITIGLRPAGQTIPKGTPLECKIGYVGSPAGTDLAVLRKYFEVLGGALSVSVSSGKAVCDGVAAHLDGNRSSVNLRFDAMPLNAFLPVVVENLQKNWDAWLVDRTLKTPNWRQIMKADETAYVVLPCDEKKDIFLGHPVLADKPEIVISLCNLLPGQWLLSLHNPGDAPVTTKVRSAPDWPVFKLAEKEYTVPAGATVDVAIQEK